MASPVRHITRCATGYASALVVITLLISCGHTTEATGTAGAAETAPLSSPAAPSSPSAERVQAPPVTPDIAGIYRIGDALPPGITVQTYPPAPVSPESLAASLLPAVAAARITPPQCRDVVLPRYAELPAGQQAARVEARGPDTNIHVFGFHTPTPTSADSEPQGCGLGLVVSGAPNVAGSAARLRAPDVANATLTAARLSNEMQTPKYMLTALVGDRTVLVMTGTMAEKLDPRRALPKLFGQLVSAVAGR